MKNGLIALIALTCVAGCAVKSGEGMPDARAASGRAPQTNESKRVLNVPRALPIELIRISASPEDGVSQAFLIGKFEVTYQQFAPFIQATSYDGKDHPSSVSKEQFLDDWKGGMYPSARAFHPVCYLNVQHARAYCKWLTYVTGHIVRLPTDAEWSLASMGKGHRRAYPWGDAWDPRCANIGGDSDGFEESAPIGSFPLGATPEGVHDMAGNIWEWTSSTPQAPVPDLGDPLGGHLRGGPWCMGPDTVLSKQIAREDPDRADDKFGLRIVVEFP